MTPRSEPVRQPSADHPAASRAASSEGGEGPEGQPTLATPRVSRLGWLSGMVLLGAVVAVAVRFTEGKEFLRLAQQAQPGWLVVGLALQAATYLAQGEVYRRVARVAGFAISWPVAYRLSLAKLFVDQALPSGGISGTVLMVRALQALGMPRPTVMASIVVNTAAYYAVYVLCLGAALLALTPEQWSSAVVALAAVFASFAVVVTVSVLWLAGRGAGALVKGLAKLRALRVALEFLENADRGLSRDPRLLVEAGLCQLAIVALDATTMWVLLRAVGASAPPGAVYASFMLSSLLRTMGLVPGGLGTYEATSVVTLKMAGVGIPAALAATLVFRGLSFWLPMLPGLWFSRRALGGPARRATSAAPGIDRRAP